MSNPRKKASSTQLTQFFQRVDKEGQPSSLASSSSEVETEEMAVDSALEAARNAEIPQINEDIHASEDSVLLKLVYIHKVLLTWVKSSRKQMDPGIS
uniref:Uncharacterized protein n=1 Tax=Amphimedon queenslandica TaxID=400682 RepID=A0A1X7VKW7_AMPQE